MVEFSKVARQMSHHDRRAIMTPKRKCSFSSFSECRYVVDGGKTTTFLFSIETPSPSSQDTAEKAAHSQQPPAKCKQFFFFFFSSILDAKLSILEERISLKMLGKARRDLRPILLAYISSIPIITSLE